MENTIEDRIVDSLKELGTSKPKSLFEVLGIFLKHMEPADIKSVKLSGTKKIRRDEHGRTVRKGN